MTARSRIFSTTAFRLSAIYLAVFSVFAIVFVFSVYFSTSQLLDQQLRDTIEAELQGLLEEARQGGLPGLADGVDRRSRSPGASLYVLTDNALRVIAGNVTEVPSRILTSDQTNPLATSYLRDDGEQRDALVEVVQLPGGFRLLVGRDIAERERFRTIIRGALLLAVGLMALLGLGSWFFVSRRVLKRIDSASATGRRFMLGDLTGRLEVTGTGDEFDRLAESLNAMLDRIEQLLYSVKDVSDNIAHDLKTPLTRLRGRVEAALSGPPDLAHYRSALETTIEESDRLIKTFNGLLLIARLESDMPDAALASIDAADIVSEIAELYEPAAEEAGMRLKVECDKGLSLTANRELLGQALANLLDNAIKYGRPESGPAAIELSARRDGEAIVFCVADNGPGIAEDDRERVLKRFVRLEKSRLAPGSGLGLSLVAAVVHLHGGTLELADNRPGLKVRLCLPLKPSALPTLPPRA